MSMHFAPQWAKPIKPSGSSANTTPTTENPRKLASNSPFPALSANPRSASPTTATHPTLSYSRVTHTPSSPSVATDGYFPHQDANGEVNSHPFRYSREQILALYDEAKFRERPIELVQMAENGGVLVSKNLSRPVGTRDLTEGEKKLLATSVHPTLPARRQLNQANSASTNEHVANGLPTRRTAGYTRGEGGNAFSGGALGKMGQFGGGGGVLSPGGLDHKAPGGLGGGFGGVGKRLTRRGEDPNSAESRSSGAATWRSGPKTPSSGNFEGVLGFGGSSAGLSPSVETTEQRENGQKKWRISSGTSAGGDKTLDFPVASQTAASLSIIATPSATPIPERDASILDTTMAPAVPSGVTTPLHEAQESQVEELGSIDWFYRDPNGQEQGPFKGAQMNDWYSHSYFADDLPLRRSSETAFRPLSDLKAATGSTLQPFLVPARQRQLPPNLPIPIAALQQQALGNLPEHFRNLGVSSPIGTDPRISPQPALSGARGPHPGYDAFAQNAYAPQQQSLEHIASPGYASSPSQAWNNLAPQQSLRMGMSPLAPVSNPSYGQIGAPSPIGSAPLQYMQQQQQQPQIQQPQYFGQQLRSAPGDIYGQPWGAQGYPQQVAQQQPLQQQAYQPQTAPVQWEQQPQAQQLHQQIPQQHYTQQETRQEHIEQPEPIFAPESEKPAPVEEIEQGLEQYEPEPTPEPESVNEESENDEEEIEDQLTPESPLASTPAPVQSAWKKNVVPQSRESAEPTPAEVKAAPKIIPTPSQPPKAVDVATPGPAPEAPSSPSPPPGKPAKVKVAPWAVKNEERAAPSPSLRDIQDAEAKRLEAKRSALAEARAASASPAPTSSKDEDFVSMSWGLPSQPPRGARAVSPVVSTPGPTAPAWGGAGDAPKKTLKQIQEEEEKRKTKAAQAARVAQGQSAGVTSSSRRGYADLAAAPVKREQEHLPGWTTVGASGKASGAATPTARASTPAKPAAAPAPKPATVVAPMLKKTVALDDGAPSVEFIRWTKQALTGFKGDIDDFISVLLSFPIDPPAASRTDQMEIISDSVYANSSTLDGRRFAQEFTVKRKQDAVAQRGGGGGKKVTSLADVVKTQPKQPSVDAGFKVVKAKGKKKN
ncbi:cytoplasmic protein [Cryptococcus wingfieldii CBS 7118]|uniref:Cytoplasmic protein n=1 Tax=Cryptococcus wingfieldii CBS 7118 TaxID=1295528 RepID=A0A1E3J5C4_9TREE|nr:cytoplasmic protein [Cryptococcus wingfieldii CBS 7118]ODN95845.1 cytoplasmic protein [Cryptococcus wingfieldii CBS 7118]